MIKRIHKQALSLLLSAALVFTVIPVTALAATTEPGVSFLDSGNIEAQTEATVIDSGSTTLNSGWYVVKSGDVTINQTVTVNGDVKLILADGANLTVNGTSGDNAGIKVTQGNSLSIYAQSIGSSMGQLTATGYGNGAGIGSSMSDSSGTISIYGGRIDAMGGNGNSGAAGIGNVAGASNHFGTIGIYGGMITATNGHHTDLPDIGGNGDTSDSILIQGGTIVNSGSGQVILGVSEPSLSLPKMVIEGGSIQLGSTFLTSSHQSPFTNSDGNPVPIFPDVLTVPGKANAAVSSISINGVAYGSSLFTDNNGNLYLHPQAYDSAVPIVVTMADGSIYWGTYQPNADGFGRLLLVNTQNELVYPNTAHSLNVLPQDITVYKFDPSGTFSGIKDENSTLTEGTDYTVNGNAITIKADYLKNLPAGETYLSFTGLGDGNNSTLTVTVSPSYGNIPLGDSIATGYGLPGYNHQVVPPLATAYPSIVGNVLGLTTCSFAADSITSSDLLSSLAYPEIKAYLSKTKVITLSIGSDDILGPFLQIVATQFGCSSPDQIQAKLATLMQSDQTTLAADLSALNADDGSGLKNNQRLKDAASGFKANFQNIVSTIKATAPNSKLYVTNTYNPYEGISIPYGAGTLDLGTIADSYIQTLNSAFSTNSTDYTLIDIHSAFSNSLKSGTSLVNANKSTCNFDPHPNINGHIAIANMILTAAGHAPTAQTASTSINNLSGYATSDEVAGAAAQVLGLSSADQSRIATPQVARLETLLLNLPGVAPLSIPAPVTTGFSGSSALAPISPTVTGLTLATYGGTGATLSTTQQPNPSNIPGAQVTFDLTLMEPGIPLPIHSKLSFPVTVTVRLPSDFVPKAGYQYSIRHFLQGSSSELLPAIIGGTAGNYTATFSTFSFSLFTLVGTDNSSSSGAPTSNPSETGSNAAATFVSDTSVDFSVNGTYRFKITSKNGEVPSFIVGTSGVFSIQLVGVSGNDYYFQLTAIGKAGEKAGIYVNGVKLLAATVGTAVVPVKSDTTVSFKIPKGSAYTFKLTSNGKPSFTSDNSSVFQVKFIKQSGKDYFYQITAVGMVDGKAGIYVNGAKLLDVTVGTAVVPVKSDTTAPFRVAKGKTYTFKLTSNSKPSFTTDNSSVFQVKFIKQSGRDYFYQVTAAGKSGQTARFYINAAKTPIAVASVA